jgi:hypothetical protein
MKANTKTKNDLNKKFQKVAETPASFAFYIAIHDFIQYIEVTPPLTDGLSHKLKVNRELGIPDKYNYLKQIHQALEDIRINSKRDLGHDRYSVMRDMNRIQSKDLSESNSFWKKRELFRKLSGEIYTRLDGYLAEAKI